MRKLSSKGKLIVSVLVLLVVFTVLGTAAAQKSSVPKPQDRLAMGEQNVKQLLLLMDTDKNGMVTEQAYMEFMKAEFHHLDTAHHGELNARALAQSNLTATNRFTGK
jgi:hypothetical protein